MQDASMTDIVVNLSAINTKLDTMNTSLTKIDGTLNNGKTGLKTRTALLEQSNCNRTWRERFSYATIIGIIVKLFIG